MRPDDFQRESVQSFLDRWAASYLQYGQALTPEQRAESRNGMVARVREMTKDWDEESRHSIAIPADPFPATPSASSKVTLRSVPKPSANSEPLDLLRCGPSSFGIVEPVRPYLVPIAGNVVSTGEASPPSAEAPDPRKK